METSDLSPAELQELQRQNRQSKNPHFHDEIKCEKLREFRICYLIYGKVVCVRKAHCNTHDIDVCFCGWEVQWLIFLILRCSGVCSFS